MHVRTLAAGLALAGTLGFGTAAPAKADGAASTRNIILGAAAAVAGLAISANVAHKNAEATTIQGYLPDGSAVYADGHVATPNGSTYYPGDQGRQVSCNGQSCWVTGGVANDNASYGAYDGRYRHAGSGVAYAGRRDRR